MAESECWRLVIGFGGLGVTLVALAVAIRSKRRALEARRILDRRLRELEQLRRSP